MEAISLTAAPPADGHDDLLQVLQQQWAHCMRLGLHFCFSLPGLAYRTYQSLTVNPILSSSLAVMLLSKRANGFCSSKMRSDCKVLSLLLTRPSNSQVPTAFRPPSLEDKHYLLCFRGEQSSCTRRCCRVLTVRQRPAGSQAVDSQL
jgi:hypothetical protein